jgi:hypothetical protein
VRGGQELWRINGFGSLIVIRRWEAHSFPPQNPSRPSPIPLWLQPPPPLFPFVGRRPLSLPLLLPQVIAALPLYPSRPTSSPRCSLPAWYPSCGCESSIGVWREEEGRKEGGKEEPKVVDFRIVLSTIPNSWRRQVNTVVVATVWFASYALSLSMHKY